MPKPRLPQKKPLMDLRVIWESVPDDRADELLKRVIELILIDANDVNSKEEKNQVS